MAYTDKIDTSLPAGTDDPSEADDNMRRIQAGFQEILAVEHDVDLTGTEITGDGKHTDITTDSIVNAGTLENTGALNVTGAAAFAETLDVTGNMDPTTYETTNGGFLDEDNMASDAANKVASQQSIKTYVDNQAILKENTLVGQTLAGIFGPRTQNDTVAGALVATSIYRAQCDGFFFGYGADANAYIVVYLEALDTTPDVAVCKVRNYAAGGVDGGFCVPVVKSDYLQVTVSLGTIALFWQPIGTGGLVKQ